MFTDPKTTLSGLAAIALGIILFAIAAAFDKMSVDILGLVALCITAGVGLINAGDSKPKEEDVRDGDSEP